MSPHQSRLALVRGHTITELMVTMTILLMVMAAVLSSHMFGLRLFEVGKAKLGASDDARAAISSMISEIRSSKIIRIGAGDDSSFAEVAMDTPQRGSAIQIYPTTNMSSYTRYFRDSNQKLKRLVSGSGTPTIVANAISNQVLFTAEDYTGAVLTNNENNRVIGVTLQFFQLDNPAMNIGPGSLYDFYQLRTKITRRTVE